MVTAGRVTAYRGQLLHFLDDPLHAGDAAWQYIEDGLLLVREGLIDAQGEAAALLPALPAGCEIIDYRGQLLLPGLIDTHIHYPQTEIIAAYGEQLLSWLETYTFPTEARFSDPAYAAEVAEIFLTELLRHGTTTALVFGTVHPQSVDAIFQAARRRGLRLIAGKVSMDRHAPPALCESPQQAYEDSLALIERWHGRERLQYALTPRFAPSCSEQMLAVVGLLRQQNPGVYLQTHISESTDEVAWVQQLFPGAANYLDVYDRAGLLGPRTIFAHGVHLREAEWRRLADTRAVLAHCPSSNLFLGSGLFKLAKADQYGIRVGIGTDVGAGTSFSLLQTLAEAYKVQQLAGYRLDPFRSLYLATLGGARALDLEDCIGNFLPGKEADFIVLDPAATPMLRYRSRNCRSLLELLFVLYTLGDDRLIRATYALGQKVHDRDSS